MKDKKKPAGKTPAQDSTQEPLQNQQNLQQQLEEMTETAKRALSDLQNFKRRTEEEKASFIQFANASLFNELIAPIQNIQRSLQHEPKDQEWIKGAIQTMQQLLTATEKAGLTKIPATPGTPFDHNFHEALLTSPGEQDKILEELEPGYMLNGKVIQPARVKVGNGENS